ncbi:phage antirepressor protein [Sphingobacterium sp. DK4209]|uniref:Phage antirepressor protein n=1 Tax=Sphingobacterium zhuxiongii TaxID=2662364 RepID=A0A5Q0Q5Q7_9SPHI|nr:MULTISPECIES: phage antirepressor KilAC domain-containing protein [unclassified Sphingobacterium]MVZ67400.1 phage antirepressor protein [Sphingobacterium sp. DK4209]QGA25405.1 phage antirepressor protein [Sphingobacterium sp. dk4302]
MNQLTKLFSYNGNEVTFRNSEGVAYVNATQMAKSFDKRPTDWLRFEQAQNFLNELSKVRNHTLTELVIVSKGGSNPGTWMHEDVALEFSRWLSPAFSIWCNDRIKELLSVGITATPQTIEDMLSNPDMIIEMATKLKQLRLENQKKDHQLKVAEKYFNRVRPKELYYDDVLFSTSLITINQIAMELGMSSIKLNKILKEKGVQYKQGDKWLISSKYRDKGYSGTSTFKYINSKGESATNIEMRWTEKGREFIHSLFKN